MVFANTFLSFSLGAFLASFQAKFALGFSSNSFFHEVKKGKCLAEIESLYGSWPIQGYPPCPLPPCLVRVTPLPQRGQFFVFSYAVTELRLLRRLYATRRGSAFTVGCPRLYATSGSRRQAAQTASRCNVGGGDDGGCCGWDLRKRIRFSNCAT